MSLNQIQIFGFPEQNWAYTITRYVLPYLVEILARGVMLKNQYAH